MSAHTFSAFLPVIEDEDGAPLPASIQDAIASAVCELVGEIVEDLHAKNSANEVAGVWEEGYADACHDVYAGVVAVVYPNAVEATEASS